MVLVSLTPSEIFFSQDGISNHFGNYTPHGNKQIGETLDDILSGKCKITDIPTINVEKKEDCGYPLTTDGCGFSRNFKCWGNAIKLLLNMQIHATFLQEKNAF